MRLTTPLLALTLTGCVDLRLDITETPREACKDTKTRRIKCSRRILERHYETRLTFSRQWISFHRDTKNLRCDCV